jgi:putative FmdB family regulatory protein
VPTYEYRCKACGHQLEIVQAFSDAALTTCPSCGAEELRKVFGSVGISFKGSGFYKTDSRSSTSSSKSTSTSGAGAGSGDGSGSSTDSSSSTSSDSSSSSSSSSASTTKSA